ncbi:MAG: integrin alpha, partial [Candidatus Sumerlaeota bacterium]
MKPSRKKLSNHKTKKSSHRRINRKAALLLLVAAMCAGCALPVSAGISNNVNVDDIQSDGNGFAITSPGGGQQVSAAGDVNGDGLGDFIISAPDFYSYGYYGAAFVVFGKRDSDPVSLYDVYNGEGGFVIFGTYSDSQSFGESVAAAGDVNGDGFADVIVGNSGYDYYYGEGYYKGGGYYNDVGKAYIIYGKPDTNPVFAESLGSDGTAINPSDFYGALGASVSGAGDVNGDGFADVIVGSPGVDNDKGRAYVIFGGPDLGSELSVGQIGADVPGFRIEFDYLTQSSERFGASVSTAGDFDGDGLADLIVGAPIDSYYGNSSGAAFIIYGRESNAAVSIAGGDHGPILRGSASYMGVGFSVSTAGDTNGDGLSDVVIGTSPYDEGFEQYNNYGRAFVLLGGTPASSELRPVDLYSSNEYGFQLQTEDAFTGLGTSVSLAGDFNADGLTDVVVGEPGGDRQICSFYNYEPVYCSTGRAYVVYGQPDDSRGPVAAS